MIIDPEMDRELIEKFIEVTGESEATAAQYLKLTDGNVETAISLMFEGGQGGEDERIVPDPSVRPPILPIQEVLLPDEVVCTFPRSSNNVFERFRDFAVETQRQEEEMTHRVSGTKKVSSNKLKRLEDLFRPPSDILFLGTFMEVREHAKILNRWLLVNVQNPQEFACQILNRDLWPNKQIQEIVKDHFVLWQVLSNTADGKRYIDFYNVSEYPYLAVVDPRTGECMRTFNHITIDSLAAGLNDLLSIHASPDNTPQDPLKSAHEWDNFSVSSSKRMTPDSLLSDNSSSSKKSRDSEDGVDDSASNDGVEAGIANSVPSNSFNILGKRSRMNELELKSNQACHNILNKKEKSLNETQTNLSKTELGEYFL